MTNFNWNFAAQSFKNFGGGSIELTIPKTGLPFFDALRLYGAIDIYIGLREDIIIEDKGSNWMAKGKCRSALINGRDERVYTDLLERKKLNKNDKFFIETLHNAIQKKVEWQINEKRKIDIVSKKSRTPDSALKKGIRDLSASTYNGLESGYGNIVELPLSDLLLSYAGIKRIGSIQNLVFLPIYEGQVDFSKVINPLRFWLNSTNILCLQAYILLALRTSLFAEGYQDKLSGIVYDTDLDDRKNFNYSGLISIKSTAIGQIQTNELSSTLFDSCKQLFGIAWEKKGEKYVSNEFTNQAINMARWLMQPLPKNLSLFISSQEYLKSKNYKHIFNQQRFIKEIFDMSYEKWKGDHESVRKFAKAVASSIYFARQAKEIDKEKKAKAWYDEVTMLRSAPSPKAFKERALILLEQGHKERQNIGTIHWNEDFNPAMLLESIGNDRQEFEAFRDLFRMYLIQESTYKVDHTSSLQEIENLDEENNNQIKELKL